MRSRPNRLPAKLVILALAIAVPTAPAAAVDPRYATGKQRWLDRQYPPARSTLLGYRTAVNAKTPQLDYMLGTSGCRMPTQRRWGANVLDFVLYRYQLTPRSRRIIEQERSLCRSVVAMPALGAEEVKIAVATAAGATSRGKGGYQIDPTQPVNAFPARTIGELDEAATQRRLVPVGQVDRVTRELRAVMPADATIVVKRRYAFVTTAGHSEGELTMIADRLDRYLAFLRTEYGLRLPNTYLTLYLVRSQAELAELARALHKLEVDGTTIGYTFQPDQSAVAIIPGTQIGTLFHELFHLVVRTSFGDVPQWLDEGIASLYEVSAFEGARVNGLSNWRGPVLDQLWAQRPTLEQIMGAAWFASDAPGSGGAATPEELAADPGRLTEALSVQFATARYFALYLQQQGKLASVYRAVQALNPGDDADPRAAVVRAVESQLGPLDRVQRSFDTWWLTTKGSGGPTPTGEVIEKYEPQAPKPQRFCAPTQQIQQQQLVPCPDEPAPNEPPRR